MSTRSRAKKGLLKTGQTSQVKYGVRKKRECHINSLAEEVRSKVLSYLSLADVCKLNYMSKGWHRSVTRYLRYVTSISFQDPDDALVNYACCMRDREITALFSNCHMLERIEAFYPAQMSRFSRQPRELSQSNLVAALSKLPRLRSMEISDLNLMSELRATMPLVQMPVFRNIFDQDRKLHCQWLNCPSVVQEVELSGITLHHLPWGLRITKLHLHNVTFRQGLTADPARVFMPHLRSFMMSCCVWPPTDIEQTNLALFIGLASCRHLQVLHLIRVAMEGQLLRSVIDAHWTRCKPFSKLTQLVLASNYALHENDLGAILACSHTCLERLYIQKSLTRDIFIQALLVAAVQLPQLKALKLGYTDEHTNQEVRPTLAERALQHDLITDERPCQLSDYGLRMLTAAIHSRQLTSLSIHDCPYLNSPLLWIADIGKDFWERLTEFTLSHCPTTRLQEFNGFLPRLRSLQILTIIGVFPAPPKGCSRVGLSAGMNIGGENGIRAIISQPPANTASSLLSVPDIDVAEMKELLRCNRLTEPDAEDTMVFANPSEGYRHTQVHSSCTTTSQKIRRSRVLLKSHERLIRGHPNSESKQQPSSQQKRRKVVGKRRLNRQPADGVNRRRSPRLQGQELGVAAAVENADDSDDSELELIVSISRKRLSSSHQSKDVNTDSNKRVQCEVKQPLPYDHNQLTGPSSPIPKSSDDSDGSPNMYRCLRCASPFDKLLPTARPLQLIHFRGGVNRHGNNNTSRLKTCIKCIKKQCEAVHKQINIPSITQLRPSQSAHGDIDNWMVFDTTSGYSKLCILKQSNSLTTKWRVKGKAPLKPSHNQKFKRTSGKNTQLKKGTRSEQLQAQRMVKGKTLAGSSSAPQLKTDCTTCRTSTNTPQTPGRKRPGDRLGEDVEAKRRKPPATADKETHTKDPFIESDTEQVLKVDNSENRITNINISNCGLTKLSLTHAHSLVAVTAHACPVLREMVFPSNPVSAPNLVRVTQCPKMSLPRLLSAFKHKTISSDVCGYVRTIEFEPLDKYNREEALIEFSQLPEVNKVMIECHKMTSQAECIKLKTFYQSLLKDMTSCGNAGYRSEVEFKIFKVVEYGEEIIVCHNIPSCSTKISPSCTDPFRCEISSNQGHKLQGNSVLCFVYPVDSKK